MTTKAVAKRAKTTRQRTYSDAERAAALAAYDACGHSLNRAAADSGIPRKTLERWVRGRMSPGKSAGAANWKVQADATLDDKLDYIAHRMAGIVANKPDEDISARDAMVSLGIAVDKKLLLRGLPTVIHGEAHPLLSKLPADVLRALAAGEVPAVVDALPPLAPAARLDPHAPSPPLVAPADEPHEPHAELPQGESDPS